MLVLSKLLFLESNKLPRLFLATAYVLVLSKLFCLVRQSLLDILFQAIDTRIFFLLRNLDFAVYLYPQIMHCFEFQTTRVLFY
jgi:hypothetical protein